MCGQNRGGDGLIQGGGDFRRDWPWGIVTEDHREGLTGDKALQCRSQPAAEDRRRVELAAESSNFVEGLVEQGSDLADLTDALGCVHLQKLEVQPGGRE